MIEKKKKDKSSRNGSKLMNEQEILSYKIKNLEETNRRNAILLN